MKVSQLRLLHSTARSAVISPDGRYRYLLRRETGPWSRGCCFIMLNPSTADGETDDPTIRKCMSFARRWQCGELLVVNLFALRATQPATLWKDGVRDPVGAENQDYIAWAVERTGSECGPIIAAWGVNGGYMDQDEAVLAWLSPYTPQCLRLTKHGYPEHPLYIPLSCTPRLYDGVRRRSRDIPWSPR